MNTEELIQENAGKKKSLHFDAHEFDGLRDALEKEAETMFARLDQYIRENPWTCIGLAAAAGFAVACAAGRTCSRDAAERR
jgi:ElaB/YqjD/DUF883 family membrane-anchored ribosome-binding protein